MPTFMQIFMHPLFSLLIGSVVTWFFAWIYYKRAGDQLRAEAQSLQTATGAILYFLENPGAKIDVARNIDGKVTGLVVQVSGQASVSFSPSGTVRDAAGRQ